MKINAFDNLNFLLDNIDCLTIDIQPLWHPLGFASCVIKKDISNFILRVHYWPTNMRRTKNPDWPIHTHSYTLSSLVLNGSIEDIQYETAPGDEYTLYKVAYINEDSEIINTNKKINIFKKISKIRTKGDQYRVERGVFHQSNVKFTESAVTLVALSEPSNEAPLVLGKSEEFRYPYDRTPFDKELFWSAVRYSIEDLIHQK